MLKNKYPLFCAGMGTGKTEVMANKAMIDASQSSTALIGCYAPTYDLLKLITASRITQKLIENDIRHTFNQSDMTIYTANSGFGDFILRTLDNPARIVGYETYTAHVDELDTLKTEHARMAWNQVIARNRQQPRGMAEPFNQVSAYTTPEGFKFCHDRWVTNANKYYGMVQASTYSNPYLPMDYIESLKASYPASLIEAYIEGKFVNLTSGAVYPEFNRTANATLEKEQDKEPLHVGMDFNVYNMAAVVCVIRDGEPLAVRELTGIRDTPAMIESLENLFPERKIYIYPDASGRNSSSKGASLTDINMLRAHFTVRARASNPRIKDRIMSVNAVISSRLFKVNVERCSELTDGLEQQAYDKNELPDKSSGVDHVLDALGYFIYWHFPVSRPQFSVIESSGV